MDFSHLKTFKYATLTCEPSKKLCDSLCHLLFRQCLHILRLMSSDPPAESVTISEGLTTRRHCVQISTRGYEQHSEHYMK